MLESRLRRVGSGRAIDDLTDSVDRFSFAGTATEDKNFGDEVEVGVVLIMLPVVLAILAEHNAGNAHRFPAVAAKYSSKMRRFCDSDGGH